jgi:energy-coupling factor transporter ATP-binding protein EcfA2
MPARILTDERVFICGKTGSGKTTLAKWLTKSVSRLIVLDSKGTLGNWNLAPFDREAREKWEGGERCRVRVVAPLDDLDSEEGFDWSEVFAFALSVGNVTLYIDELFAIVEPGRRASNAMSACYTRGREFGIGVWASTQRPSWVPMFTISESEHYFLFRLTLAKDRQTMAAFMTEQVETPIQDPHGFYYMNAQDDAPKYFSQLEIGNASARANGAQHTQEERAHESV